MPQEALVMIAEKRKLFLVSSLFPLYLELCMSISSSAAAAAAAAAVGQARGWFRAVMRVLPQIHLYEDPF